MKAKIGDVVLKHGDLDNGRIGIILEIVPSDIKTDGYRILKVLRSDGHIVGWYIKVVEVISESR